MPIFKCAVNDRTSGSQAWMHGGSSHITHGAVIGLIVGVPAAGPWISGASTMAWGGHALTQSLQRVQLARNAGSSDLPPETGPCSEWTF